MGPVWLLTGCLCLVASAVAAEAVPEIVVTNDYAFEPGVRLAARLVVRASHVTIDGRGAVLAGPGTVGDPKSLEDAGVGVLVEDATGVTVKHLAARGFATGLVLRRAEAVVVVGCDFSDNYHNPGHGWGELPPRGGIYAEGARHCVIQETRANRVWDGLHLVGANDNLIEDNDFSKCSNTCAKLWRASRNKFLHNNLSHGIRINREAGEVHARDSTGVLIETGSDDNYWYGNDITHGGDGVFIRPLNRWVSKGNVFVGNDMSYANNNCVESWSPGNTFIRNRANHGSYGFWLGGSDQTVLVGNEAAFNGLTNGYHNAPEAGFGHGGIVIVGGPATHTRIEGNHLHHNNGAGIAFRGDTASEGLVWRTEHWLLQRNRIEHNRIGIWGRWGSAIVLAGNTFTDNALGNWVTNTTDWIELAAGPITGVGAPVADLMGPETVLVGQKVRFDAASSGSAGDLPLSFRWWFAGQPASGPVVERLFNQPGFVRVSLTVDNGVLADMAWRDVIVVEPVDQELGTEGGAVRWGFELENNDHGRGRVGFADEAPGLIGNRCLRVTPDPYPGAYATVIYPATRDAGWDWSGRSTLRFWIRARNPNVPGWQNAGPVVRLIGPSGHRELRPAAEANLLNDPPFSEARWLWMPVVIALAGDTRWADRTTGEFSLGRVDAISLAVDSWGGDSFTLWLDGLCVE